MEVIEASEEVLLAVLLDNVISGWLERRGCGEGQDIRQDEQAVINAAVAWLEKRYIE